MFTPLRSLDVDRRQDALTQRFLWPARPVLERFFLELRAQVDAALAVNAPELYGARYPYGYCYEITAAVMARLRAGVSRPTTPGARAIAAFLKHGGDWQMVWGVLRERYFQNAIQLGSLYIDVSNDTVDITKPKVEILPMDESGLVMVRDVEHFVRIGEAYFKGKLYANTVLPSLAPAFPMFLVDRKRRCQIVVRNTHMMRLFGAEGFRAAEAWLRDGPRPPSDIVAAFRAACPEVLLAQNLAFGAQAAIEACQRLRAAHVEIDAAWLGEMLALHERAPAIQMALAQQGRINDVQRSNARLRAGIKDASAEENQMLSLVKLERNRNIFLSMGK